MVLYMDRMCQRGLQAMLWSYIGTLTHRLTAEPSQYRRTIIPLSVSLWNDLVNPVFGGVVLEGFKSRAMLFLWA